MIEHVRRLIAAVVLFACAVLSPLFAPAQPAASSSDLRFVLVLTRHGVRSPTHPSELAAYAAQPWQPFSVAAGDLTQRGAMLMQQFGRHYRMQYAALLGASGCPPPGSVFVWADLDQRTKATGEALLEGLAPSCGIAVHHAAGQEDPLFDPLAHVRGKVNAVESRASVAGAIGADPSALVRAYAAEYAALEGVLQCGGAAQCKDLSTVPTSITPTGDGGLSEVAGGLDLAGTAAENLMLAYDDNQGDAGWGRLDAATLLEISQLHVVQSRLERANRYAARVRVSNIVDHVVQALQQAATGRRMDTRVPPATRFAVISGHDSQLDGISGLLGLSWLLPGYQANDTPPGGALLFELHRPAGPSSSYVDLYYTAQTTDEMRSGNGSSPARVAVYVPGCPSMHCPLATFVRIANAAIDPAFVASWH